MTVVVTNTGNLTLSPTVVDTLTNSFGDQVLGLAGPVESISENGLLDVGETWTYTGSYTVTQADIDAGVSIVNEACIGDIDLSGAVDADECSSVTTPVIQDPDATVAKSTSLDPNEVDGPGAIPYEVVVTNTGNLTLSPTVVDTLTNSFGDQVLGLAGPVESISENGLLDVGETWTYTGSYTVTQADIDAGVSIVNEACIGDIDDSGAIEDDECSSVTTPIIQNPDATVVKSTSLDPNEVDGPGAIPYTVVVTNTGNLTLSPTVVDTLTNSLGDQALGLSGPVESVADDGLLNVGETWTFTGSYTVTQADIDAGVSIVNEACIGDIDDSGAIEDDECSSVTTPIIQNPAHTLVKRFVPDEVGDGEVGTFELLYTNTGNVTLHDIVITDEVDKRLLVDEASLPAECTMADQTLTCNAGSLAPDASVTFVVTFTALGENLVPTFPDQTSGSSYVFYFENGYILYGSTFDGSATLLDPDGNLVDEADWDVEGRNQDIFFTVPTGDAGDDGGFFLHLSCSEAFIDGWGATGPDAEDDPDWRVVAYTVERYNSQGFLKDCTQTFPFEVPNTASATATPAGGILTPNPVVSDEVFLSVVNIAPIKVTRDRYRRGAVEIQYFNTSYEPLEISIINVGWPDTDIQLVSASYQDGEPLFTDLGCPIVDGACLVRDDDLTTTLDARSKDWLKLKFEKDGSPIEPENVTVTIVTSDGATFSYVYNPVP